MSSLRSCHELTQLYPPRIWAGSESFVLAGASYGTYVALEYAIKYGRRLDGLILRGAWANGKAGPMNALANILVSPRIQVDAARQVRAWSGTLRDDQDFQDAVVEVMPFFAPPSPPTPSSKASTRGSVAAAATTPPVTTGTAVESTEFQGSVEFHSATHNYAFSENLPRFDVRPQLHMIKVCQKTAQWLPLLSHFLFAPYTSSNTHLTAP